MSFISYAQNTEDVLLWRALGHIQAGFYIDVGANDPVTHSVTKAFYDAGWRGINIEPLPAFHDAFIQQRPRDINLAVAAGAAVGEIVLFDVPAVNGWASSAPDVAATHRAEGYELVEMKVPLRTLNDICDEHVAGDVHFLKIDVEGFEREVLLGLDLRRWRPWVLVIEATMPNSRETNHETWEDLVTGGDYLFAYFDGLNRYYVAAEHKELLASLQVQANVFDDFITVHLENAWRANAALQDATERQQDAQARLQAANESLTSRDTELLAATTRLHALDAELRTAQADMQDLRQQLHAAGEQRQTLEGALRAVLARADGLEQELRAGLARNEELERQLHAANAWGNGLATTLDAVYASRSWRLSSPLRVAGRIYRRLARGASGTPVFNRAAAVTALKRVALHRLRALAGSPTLRKYVVPQLLRIPGVKERLLRLVANLRETAPAAADQAVLLLPGVSDLSPLARQAFADLERARRRSSNQ